MKEIFKLSVTGVPEGIKLFILKKHPIGVTEDVVYRQEQGTDYGSSSCVKESTGQKYVRNYVSTKKGLKFSIDNLPFDPTKGKNDPNLRMPMTFKVDRYPGLRDYFKVDENCLAFFSKQALTAYLKEGVNMKMEKVQDAENCAAEETAPFRKLLVTLESAPA